MSNRQLVGSRFLLGFFFTTLLAALGLSGCGSGGDDSAENSAVTAFWWRNRDTIAPSVPAVLTASAVSSAQIDIAWSPSTDNRAVTGYIIRRDGTLLTNVGKVTT